VPLYEYECKKCGEVFEVSHGMSEEPKVRCPKCKAAARRLISGGMGVMFKGAGFHTTDSRGAQSMRGRDELPCGRDTPCKTCPAVQK